MFLDLQNTMIPIDQPAIVAGLSMRLAGDNPIIGGPAIYAALGVRHVGIGTALLTAVGQDLTEAETAVVTLLDDEHVPLRKTLCRPMLTWRSPKILGSTGRGSLSDDPSEWRAMPSNWRDFNGRILVLANGDPDWYQSLLTQCEPSLIFMDAHIEWLRMRGKSLNVCLQKASVVTITETEYKTLPVLAKSGVNFNQEDKALIIKRGSQGVTILVGHESIDLPPPSPSVVRTDVGCGDLLIGLLAGHFMASLSQVSPTDLLNRLCQAYMNSLPELASLIESERPQEFIDHCLN